VLLRHFRHVRIDQCNRLGFTALMKAAIQGRTRCAKLLLFAGEFSSLASFITLTGTDQDNYSV
jgi:ankyrin repeat protein